MGWPLWAQLMRGVPRSGTSRPLPVWCRKIISTFFPHVMVISAWLVLYLSIPFRSICSFPAQWQLSSFCLSWSCKSFFWAFLILFGCFCPDWAGISGTKVCLMACCPSCGCIGEVGQAVLCCTRGAWAVLAAASFRDLSTCTGWCHLSISRIIT